MEASDLNEPNPSPPPEPAAPPPAEAAAVPPQPTNLMDWLKVYGRTLVYLGVLLAAATHLFGWMAIFTAAVAGLGLGFVIFIHELGHFAVAKWCDVHVETFSIGFGPPLPGCVFQRGETTYMIGSIPLGGYVKMIGENPDSEEEDTDPRSFQNKGVLPRMAIISAGVFMNMVLGCLCFVIVFMTKGVERAPGVVGRVDSGGQAWKKGVQAGMIVQQIGTVKNPTFEQLMAQVMLSRKDEQLPFSYGFPGQTPVETTIEPRNNKEDGRPIIGMGGPDSLKLLPEQAKKELAMPVLQQSAAAHANPPFQFGDEIIGCTDPATGQVTLLPKAPDNPTEPDFFAFRRRAQELAGKDMIVRVRRGKTEQDIKVPPAYQYVLGIRMKMGPVVAVRDSCPAQKAGVRVKGQVVDGQPVEGDQINSVEVEDAQGQKILWVWTTDEKLPEGSVEKKADPAEKDAKATAPIKKILDPMRLPFDLEQWADARRAADPQKWGTPEARTVVLTVRRSVKHETTDQRLSLVWDDSFRFDTEVPINYTSPMPIGGLGLAYQVQTTISAVTPGSPAAKVTTADGKTISLQKDDVIKKVCLWAPGKDGAEPEPAMKRGMSSLMLKEKAWQTLESPDCWPTIAWMFEHQDIKKLDLLVERGNETLDVTIKAEEDPTWPVVNRGYRLQADLRVQKAQNLGEAISLGFNKSFELIGQIYQHIDRLITRRLSPKLLGGPIKIFEVAYRATDNDIYTLILFMGMISVNLAVVNFLPIPVLDGGHMVFLIYEFFRGKPASLSVRAAANWIGLSLIGSLMLFVIFMDVSRFLW